jgi:hypothetical protein
MLKGARKHDPPESDGSGFGRREMKTPTVRRSFAGGAELVQHAARASAYLKEVCAACAAGDKAAAQRALRQAIIELETARAGLRIGRE